MYRLPHWGTSAAAGVLALGLFPLANTADAAVGRVEASFGVGKDGGPSYVIPIRATEGIAGMTPRLAIAYGAPHQKGILGNGFTISGLSEIAPCPKTIAQDTTPGPIKLASGDRYCLDGARLRLVSGGYGDSNSTYATEVDQLARVTVHGSVNYVPGYFEVDTRDGLEYEYGNTADSLVRTSTGSNARTQFWALNRISDRAGNAIVFSYENDDDAYRFRPSQIRYTDRSGTTDGNYTIDFVYQTSDQPDPSTYRTSSSGEVAVLIQNRLLQRLELKHQGTIYRQYLFSYETSPAGNSRLTAIEECAATTSDCFPATVFDWEDATVGHDSALASGGAASNPQPLDLNGDGFEDVVWAQSGTWRYMLGSASGYGSPVNTSVTATNPTKAMVLDWNGDGFDDFLIDWSDSKWRVLRGTASGFASAQHAGPGSGIPSNTAASGWWVADINGDARDDLLRIRTTTTQNLKIWVRLGGVSGFGSETVALDDLMYRPASQLFGSIAEKNRSRVRRADFNGDGLEDLLIRGCEWDGEGGFCLWIGWYQLFSQGSTLVSIAFAASDATSINRPLFGNFNADKLTDFVYSCQYSVQWCAALSNGESGYSLSYGPSSSGYTLHMVGDYDGDGFDDLYAAKVSTLTWDIIRGSGDGLEYSTTATGLSTAGAAWSVTDHDGDGLADLGYFGSGYWRTYSRSGVPGDVLASATDGLGNSVEFNYRAMSDASIYTRGTGAAYPVQEYSSFRSLVESMTVTPGGGIPYTLAYTYADARVHVQGRGYLGMGSRTVVDDREDVVVKETFEQTFPYTGAIKSSITEQADETPIRVVLHTYDKHTPTTSTGNERELPYRKEIETQIYEVGGSKNGSLITEITEIHTVSALGNTTAATVTTVDKDSGSSEYGYSYLTEFAATYTEDTTNWCLALPTSRSETRTLPDATSQTRAIAWTVSGSACRVTQEVVEPGQGSTLSLVTDVEYDSCGNVDLVSTYPAGQSGSARTTTIDYGSRCQRPESITNPENETWTLEYKYTLGLVSSLTDPNGIEAQFEYDSFGRMSRQLNPDGTATRVALAACNSGNSYCDKDSSVKLKVTQTARNTSDAVLRTDERYLDGVGRARWAHSDSLESGAAMIETEFDAFGRISQRSQPRYAGGSTFWTTIEYDLLGRPTEIVAPVDRITAIAYEGRNIKVTDPLGNITSRVSDVIGQLRAVVDPSPGGTTTYTYKPFGELASITDAASNTATWSYNLRGFVTQTDDPDSGTWNYVPNAFGELTSQTDEKDQTVSFTYDKLSRPLIRDETEGETAWAWGNSPTDHNVGRLASIESEDGSYSEFYSYDSLGRLSQQKVTADGTPYYINLTYTAATGLPATLEYPTSTSGYRLKLGYEYANNLLKKVKDQNGSTVFWEAISTDAWGHYQDESFGNGVDTFTNFDQATGLPVAREASLGSTLLLDATLTWDKNGNVTKRQDLLQSLTEEIWYDTLNRFDYSKLNGSENQNVTLAANGNITEKGGLAYTYTGAQTGCTYYAHSQPHAVRKIGSTVYCYDPNGNMSKRAGSTIGYTSYNLPSSINSGSNSSTLSYGAFRNRYKQVAIAGGTTETTIYVGGLLEKVTKGGVTEYRHLIHGGAGLASIYTRRSSGSPATDTFYVHTDHLGSPELITNASGGVVVRMSFAAYGERQDASDWSGAPPAGDLTTIGNSSRLGFTGHEHLDSVGLIHMNGRVYDPLAGRFLSADPIQAIGFSQDANLYAYAWNNPLTIVDPTGLAERDVTDPPEPGGPIHPRQPDHFNWFPFTPPLSGFNYFIESVTRPNFNPDLSVPVESKVIAGAGNSSTVDGTGAVGQPGPVEGFVPIWGSGRAAVDDFQSGRWGWGSFNSVMAVSDIALVKSAITALGKGAWKGGSHGWKATRAWLGRTGFAEKWQHVHHAIVTHAYFRGTRGEAIFNQTWNLRALEPPPGVTMDTWHKMIEGKLPGLNVAERWWYGMPDWIRYAEISAVGDTVTAIEND
jgi:RHS repeat-associated protein